MRKIAVWTISGFKYLLAVFMMWAGIATAAAPLQPTEVLGFIYSSRIALVLFGLLFFISGMSLLIGKIRKDRKMVGWGLGLIFCCFLFAGLLNGFAGNWEIGYYLGNFIMAGITGLLYLRWKLKFFYV